jgi:hypothetical protein
MEVNDQLHTSISLPASKLPLVPYIDILSEILRSLVCIIQYLTQGKSPNQNPDVLHRHQNRPGSTRIFGSEICSTSNIPLKTFEGDFL